MSMRVGSNTVEAVIEQYRADLSGLYGPGETRAITSAVFFDRLGWDASELLLNRNTALSESELLKVYLPLKRLRNGEPLQYVLGSVDFHGVQLMVDRRVLIPRPETEELVQRIVEEHREAPSAILDVGTGSAAIALALKKRWPSADVIATDVSSDALELARENAARNKLNVQFIQHDALGAVPFPAQPRSLQVVVSNPPYIPLAEAGTLAANVRDHEPHLALFVADDDPIVFHRRIATAALNLLVTGGSIWFECHFEHTDPAGRMLEELGYADVQVMRDLSNTPRFVRGRR
jgi:release factor glutamine methyltransferase